jgi:membrane-anchored protein YejM (alkaline phosphatase superfamily)
MALAFYKSDHFPYEYPPEDSIFLPAGDINLMLAGDDTDPVEYRNDNMNSKHYVDRLVGEVLRQIDSLGDLSNTIVVVSSDHSDELNDCRANYWGHGTNFTRFQSCVPFILYLPDHPPQQINYPTSHIDLVPTLLPRYFGCTNDIEDYSNGRDLYDEPKGIRPMVVGNYANHAFIIGDNVYEIYPMYTKKYKLQNVRQEADPPDPQILKEILREITCFYEDNDSHK